MLTLTIPETELYNEKENLFVYVKERTIQLEHSLLSISKWESIWKKPFLTEERKTKPEIVSYVKCMTITPNVPDDVYRCLTRANFKTIEEYIDDKMTATTVKNTNKKRKKEIITSEVIYFWMIENDVPFQCEKWHLNRLLTLIEVCAAKSSGKKMSKKDIMSRNDALNEARKAKYKTSG